MKAKKYSWLILVLLLMAAAVLLLLGGEKPEQAEIVTETEPTAESVTEPEALQSTEQKAELSRTEKEISSEQSEEKAIIEESEMSAEPETSAETQPAELSAEELPEPEPLTCTVSVSCVTVLDHMEEVSDAAKGLVPSSGYLLGSVTVEFTEGETIFDILQRVLRENGISMEYSQSVTYSSAYVEGIGGLYEFDVGELSGWMYAVNGVFPHYGCSHQTVENGDTIAWLYTCDLGGDIGGSNF